MFHFAAKPDREQTGGMSTSFTERELKFDVEPGFVVPDIGATLPMVARTESRTEHLRSEYFDTSDHALLRARMTLRRRTGTVDAGWQLKVPAGRFREEVRLDDTAEAVPDELRSLLTGVGRGQPLLPIARVSTVRSVTALLDSAGELLAEIDDDTVHASAAGAVATVTTWREVEVELGSGLAGDEVELLYALGKRLRRAGARPSASRSKLARALDAERPRRSGKHLRAGDVVCAYIAEQQREILSGDLALRRGQDDVVHHTRVATRRLRSTLRVFGSFFDPARAQTLDEELRWYAELLGAVRDRQVLRLRLLALADELDPALLLGPVRARINRELRREQAREWKHLQAALSHPRYLALLAEIDAWVQHPPLQAEAKAPGAAVEKLVLRAERKVATRLKTANTTRDVADLHRARKAAKRARYAAEAGSPVLGQKRGKRHAKRYRWLQDLLGEHQDSVMSAEVLLRLGAKAGTTPSENGFAFGVMHERELRTAQRVRQQARRAAARY